MSGVEGLQQVGGLPAANLADHDVIRAMTQGMAHQVADRHRPFLQPASLEADAVGPLDAKLQGVLDGDDTLVIGQEFNERIEQRGLARSGAAGNQDVAPRA